jgi:hypothetical protein
LSSGYNNGKYVGYSVKAGGCATESTYRYKLEVYDTTGNQIYDSGSISIIGAGINNWLYTSYSFD